MVERYGVLLFSVDSMAAAAAAACPAPPKSDGDATGGLSEGRRRRWDQLAGIPVSEASWERDHWFFAHLDLSLILVMLGDPSLFFVTRS
jgi:hypothetical protein